MYTMAPAASEAALNISSIDAGYSINTAINTLRQKRATFIFSKTSKRFQGEAIFLDDLVYIDSIILECNICDVCFYEHT